MDKTNIHILMVEDNESDTLIIQHRLLHALGGKVTLTHVESIAEALSLISRQRFDLILSDLCLPDSDGVETIHKLKSATEIPIAVLTYNKDEKLAIRVIKAGAQDYLEKDNLSERALIRLVRYSIERKRVEERTRKAQRRFQTIFEKAPLGIAHISIQCGNFVDVNPRYAYITGRTIAELMQLRQMDIIHPEDMEAYSCDMLFLNKNKPANWKTCKRIVHADGSTIWVEMTYAPFEVSNDDQICYVCMIEDITERKRMLANLRDLTTHLQNVREEERMRIGREIHDVIGGSLAVIKLELDWLSRKITEHPVHERILSLHQLTGEAIETARRVSQNLRPNVLDNLGLMGAVEWLVRDFEQRMNIHCTLTSYFPRFPRLEKEAETSIFRIIQEAFINITRHAQATAVKMEMGEMNGAIYFRIKDDGVGITYHQLSDPKSFGIIGMQERAQQLNGELAINGVAMQGTVVTLQIPVPLRKKRSQGYWMDDQGYNC